MERGSENGENMANLCRNNCGFFGNPATNNLCSKCYKLDCSLRSLNNSSIDSKESKNLEVEFKHVEHVGASEETPVDFAVKEPAIRCAVCNKKVGLTAFKCRCENMFCLVHRYSDKHSCNFDYRRLGQDAIAKANPIIKADKIDKI